MPEGPEIRIITEWLHKNFKNSVITNILYNDRSSLHKNGTCVNIKPHLPLRVEGVTCKGKHIIFMCKSSNNQKIYFHNHLAMTGRWITTKGKHSNISLVLGNILGDISGDSLSPVNTLYFDDVRHFGSFSIQYNLDELNCKLSKIGHDLMDCSIKYYQGDKDYLIQIRTKWVEFFNKLNHNTRSKKRNIYSVLMDQKYFSGIGNYVAAEVLYKTKISPKRCISDISLHEIIMLFNAAIEILYSSYSSNGLSFKDYLGPNHKKGVFKRQIYGKEKDINGYLVVKTKLSNRTSHWVPEIQK